MDRPNITEFCDGLKLNRFHWSLLGLGILTLICDGYDSQVLSYVMPHVIKEWHLSPVVAGSVVSYGLIGLMIGTATLGMLADRVGRKIPLILGLIIFSGFNGGLFWTHNFKTFCILRFFAGIGMGGTLVLNITLASEFAPARIRARVVGIMLVGFLLGPALAGLCSILFIPAYGWRVVLFFALLPLILIPFLWCFLPESVRFLVQKGRYEKAVRVLRRMERAARIAPIEWTEESFVLPALERKASVKQLFTSKLAVMTVLVWLTYFFTLFGGYMLTTWLPTLLNKAGLSLIRSYGYTLVSNGGSIVGSVILGMALDRFGRKGSLIVIYLAAALVSWLFGLVAGIPVALYLCAVGTGIFYGGGASAQHAVTGEIYPTFVRSTGVGWALTMGRFGAICGPVFGGFLQSAGYSFSQIFSLIAVPPLICATLVFFYRINVKGEGLETVEAELTGTGTQKRRAALREQGTP
jgi:AAHS family benzoate transporter-like MFS transporter